MNGLRNLRCCLIRENRSHRRGLTLVELVATLVLCSMMMVAIVGILHASVRQNRRWQLESLANTSPITVLSVLHADLANARGYSASGRRLVLSGFQIGPDLSGQIVYEVRRIGGQSVLVRRSGQNAACVWIGCAGIELQTLVEPEQGRSEPDQEERNDTPLAFASVEGGLARIPAVFRVRCLDASGRLLHQEIVEHHGF